MVTTVTDRPSDLEACPKCGAPCKATIHSRSGDWGWGTSDAERTTYAYAREIDAAPINPQEAIEPGAEHWRAALYEAREEQEWITTQQAEWIEQRAIEFAREGK